MFTKISFAFVSKTHITMTDFDDNDDNDGEQDWWCEGYRQIQESTHFIGDV